MRSGLVYSIVYCVVRLYIMRSGLVYSIVYCVVRLYTMMVVWLYIMRRGLVYSIVYCVVRLYIIRSGLVYSIVYCVVRLYTMMGCLVYSIAAVQVVCFLIISSVIYLRLSTDINLTSCSGFRIIDGYSGDPG